VPLGHQIEKDERFWVVAALLAAFHADDRTDALTAVLRDALGPVPPVAGLGTWAEALGPEQDLQLYFEVNLPAPSGYKRALARDLGAHTLVPWQRTIAEGYVQRAGEDGVPALEGATKVDAVLLAPSTGFAVAFEAKVLSDTSSHTTYDARRNQIARNLDVLLDDHSKSGLRGGPAQRRPDLTCFVLLTPEVFRKQPSARLYGHLMKRYEADAEALREHLPHRDLVELAGLRGRLGWTSWERLADLVPGACRWLAPPAADHLQEDQAA
jgi:hypothetical protein